jgi:membrane protein implicated in regulation of membrane protease activity
LVKGSVNSIIKADYSTGSWKNPNKVLSGSWMSGAPGAGNVRGGQKTSLLLGYNTGRGNMKGNTRLIIAVCSSIIEVAMIILIVRMVLPYWEINIPVYGLVLICCSWLVLSVVVYRIGSRALDRRIVEGLPSISGTRGVVIKDLVPEGMVKIKGEYWRAYSSENAIVGQEIEVISQKGLLLFVRPVGRQV